jgi:very-short-patch-repair endonuclease
LNYNIKIVRAYFAEQKLPEFVTEHKFAAFVQFERKDGRIADRGWKFDFAWLDEKVALEVEGGIFVGGRHTNGAGFAKDMLKYNTAVTLGWRILRCQPKELCMQETVNMIRKTLCL